MGIIDLEKLRALVISDVSPPEGGKELRAEVGSLRDLSRDLKQLRVDLAREEHYATTKVYCLDFSELGAYLYPLHKRFRNETTFAQAAHFVIETGTKLITLPPGALFELLQHLESLARELRSVEVPVTELWNLLQSEEVTRFRESFAGPEGLSGVGLEIGRAVDRFGQRFPLVSRARQFGKAYPHVAHALERLNWLINERLTWFSDIVPLENADIDELEFEEALFRLSKRRPLFSLSNRVDALNFAFVHFLNTTFCRTKGFYFNLITRGIPLAAFWGQEWGSDPIKEDEALEHIPLVRDIVFAAYESLVDLMSPLLDLRIDFVSSMSKHAKARIKHFQSGLAALKAGQLPLKFENFEKKSGATLYGVASSEFSDPADFDSFVSIGRELFESDSDLEPKVLNVRDILTPEGCKVLINQQVELTSQVDAVRKTIKRRLEEAQTIVSEHLHSYQVPGPERLSELEVLDKTAETEGMEKEVKWIVAKSAGQQPTVKVVCQADLYSTFFMVSTKTWSGRFEWFFRMVNYLVAQAGSRDGLRGLRPVKKVFNGIFVLTTEGDIWNSGPLESLRFPLDPDWVWSQSTRATQGLPRLVRVNSPYMDLFYEGDVTIGRSVTGRAGIISHIALTDLIAHFIARAQESLVRVDSLQRTLERVLLEKYPR